jgi:hypothetical protein
MSALVAKLRLKESLIKVAKHSTTIHFRRPVKKFNLDLTVMTAESVFNAKLRWIFSPSSCPDISHL